MWVSKGGQYKSRGNVITFAQDLNNLCMSLPRLPEQLDVLIIRKPGTRDPSTYKDFRVRKSKVLRLLRFLKEHNPYYSHIVIRPPGDVDLPEDGDILDRLPQVVCPTEPGELPVPEPLDAVNDSLDVTADALGITFTPDELAQEQNLFVPGVAPGPSELDAVCIAMRDRSLNKTIGPLPWPSTGPPLSEYSTEGLFSMAFPTLFPTGDADFTQPRRKKLDLHEWVKHLIRYRDSRFATHPRFRFFALNLIFRHRAMQQGRFLFSRSIGNRAMTVGQLKEALAADDGPLLASKIVRCLKSVRATRPYWFMEGAKLKDMITQIGTPTLFYTLSMADLSWPDLHRLMPDDPFRPGLTDAQSFQIRMRNVTNNPHIVSAYLSTRHHHLRDTILQHLDVEGGCAITDFWFRVEWQARGSGMCSRSSETSNFVHRRDAGHIHGFLWLENAIPVDDMDWTNPDDLERINQYFSRIITASNPDPFRPRPPQDCLLEDHVTPEAREGWNFEEDHCNLCNRSQKHGTIVKGQRRCKTPHNAISAAVVGSISRTLCCLNLLHTSRTLTAKLGNGSHLLAMIHG